MNIIKEIAKSCDRDDCRFKISCFDFVTAAGAATDVECWTCKRKWMVRKPSHWLSQPRLYDREGNDVSEPPAIEIREVSNDRS